MLYSFANDESFFSSLSHPILAVWDYYEMSDALNPAITDNGVCCILQNGRLQQQLSELLWQQNISLHLDDNTRALWLFISSW